MVTKHQQLEWLALNIDDFFGMDVAQMSGSSLGRFRMAIDGKYHIITREEWQQERDKMQKKAEQVAQPAPDNSWHERGELPPVGVWCEALCDDALPEECKILAYHQDQVAVQWKEFNGGCLDVIELPGDYWKFRPLRTEREKAIDEMISVTLAVINQDTQRQMFGMLYDAGYRKVNP